MLLAVFPGAPLVDVAPADALERPLGAAGNVVSAGIGDFGVPLFIDLPEAAAFSAVSDGVWIVAGLMLNNPFGDLRIDALRFGGAFDVGPNPRSRFRIGRERIAGRSRGNGRSLEFISEGVGQGGPKNCQQVDDEERFVEPVRGPA